MKKARLLYFLVIAFLSVNCFAQFEVPEVPALQTSFYDYANLLSQTEKTQLEQKLLNYADTTSTQVVIAIVPQLNGDSAESIALKWADKWGIGQAKKDNGIFILVSVREHDMYIATGSGVEQRLANATVKAIITRYIVPEFKKRQLL